MVVVRGQWFTDQGTWLGAWPKHGAVQPPLWAVPQRLWAVECCSTIPEGCLKISVACSTAPVPWQKNSVGCLTIPVSCWTALWALARYQENTSLIGRTLFTRTTFKVPRAPRHSIKWSPHNYLFAWWTEKLMASNADIPPSVIQLQYLPIDYPWKKSFMYESNNSWSPICPIWILLETPGHSFHFNELCHR